MTAMTFDDDPNAAPCYDPGAVGLPWWRRALAQGLGYMLPSAAFTLIPFLLFRLADGYSPRVWMLAVLAAAGMLVFFLSVPVIAHWSEAWRWVWIAGLIGCIVVLGLVTGDVHPLYFTAYATAATAMLISWRKAKVTVTVLGVVALGASYGTADNFGVVMGLASIVLGWGLGTAFEGERMRQALDRAQQRTAVLAVAAERERIGRDLHDILGHSLTTSWPRRPEARHRPRSPIPSTSRRERCATISARPSGSWAPAIARKHCAPPRIMAGYETWTSTFTGQVKRTGHRVERVSQSTR